MSAGDFAAVEVEVDATTAGPAPTPADTGAPAAPTLPAGGDESRLSLTSEPESAIEAEERRFEVRGRVLDASGEPVPSALVELKPVKAPVAKADLSQIASRLRDLNRHRAERPTRRQATDPTGSFHFRGVLSGTWSVALVGRWEGAVEFELSEDVVRDLVMRGDLRLAGEVIRLHEEPVVLRLLRGWRSLRFSDSYTTSVAEAELAPDQSRFSFRGLVPGAYRLVVSGARRGTARFEFDLGRSREDLQLRLPEPLTLAGGFTVGEGIQLSNVTVHLTDLTRSEYREASALGPGRFRFEGLQPGPYELSLAGWREKQRIDRDLQLDLTESVERLLVHLDRGVETAFEFAVPKGFPLTEGRLIGRQGDAHLEQRLRLSHVDGATRHEVYVHEMYWGGWSEVDQVALLPQTGELLARLEVPGLEPWQGTFQVEAPSRQVVQLAALPGRQVRADYDRSHYEVEARPVGSDTWQRLAWKDERSLPTHTETPGDDAGWLPQGTYDLRVVSVDAVTRLLERVRIESSFEPLVIDAELQPGLAIRGTLTDRMGEPLAAVLYLDRWDGASWQRALEKTHWWGADFAFQGLTPGRYRAALDPDSSAIAAYWDLTDRDLTNQRIVASAL